MIVPLRRCLRFVQVVHLRKPHSSQALSDSHEKAVRRRPLSSEHASSIGVVLVEDHPFVRDGLSGLLTAQPGFELRGEAASAAEGLAALEKWNPDLLIVDLRLPDEDGVRVLEAAKEMRPNVRSIVLSAFKTDDDVVAAARAGARGYLVKTARGTEVLQTIRRVMAGENVLIEELTSAQRERLVQKDLTAKETEILRLLGLGLSNREICRRKKIAPNTVKTHLRHIFTKLGVSNRSQATTIALRRGMIGD